MYITQIVLFLFASCDLAGTTFSGVNDYDYPSLSSPSVGLAGMELISLLKRVPLPAELVEQFDRILSNFFLLFIVIKETYV